MDKRLKILIQTIVDEIVDGTKFIKTFDTDKQRLDYFPPFFKHDGGIYWSIWETFFESEYECHYINQSVGLELITNYIINKGYLKESEVNKLIPYIYRELKVKTIKKSKKYC